VVGIIVGLAAIGTVLFGASRLRKARHAARVSRLSTPLYVEVCGEGSPPLVLVHGLLGSGRYWEGVIPQLEKKHRLVVPDLLGFGKSPWPRSGYTARDHLAALKGTIDGVTGEPVVLVGHSMGALLAVEYANAYRGGVRALVLVAPPLFSSEADFHHRIGRMSTLTRVFSVAPALAFLVCRMHEAVGSFGRALARWLHPERPAWVASDAAEHTWESFNGSIRHVILERPLLDSLPKLEGVPVLIVYGTEDGLADGEELRRLALRSGAEFASFPGDHHLLLTSPGPVVEAIDEFLARVASSKGNTSN
jgi:pimeloyl-ACP methyl ester carboxylesterase